MAATSSLPLLFPQAVYCGLGFQVINIDLRQYKARHKNIASILFATKLFKQVN